MNILYDHQTYDFLNFGGIPRYFYELTKGMNRLGQTVVNTIKFSENIYTKDESLFKSSPFFFGNQVRGRKTMKKIWNKSVSLNYIRKNDFDLFHPTYYDTYFLKTLRNKPYVVTFHDLIHELFSDQYEFLAKDHNTIKFKKEILKNARQVISVSHTTKNDLIKIYQVPAEKIEVIGLGNSISPLGANNVNLISREYLLYVGNRVAWKNFDFCLESIASVLKENDLLFVCAGGGDFTERETNLITKLGLSKYIKYEPITDMTLASLYSNACALIFPSLYEGFGIPVLEAFACGCPCLLSSGGSLPEVGGEAALYFDPKNFNDYQVALTRIINDQVLRNSLISKGYERLKQYNWNVTCEKTLGIYNKVVNEFV
jgi:glycosyltransferase involved in cell wall biosynthesis